MHRPGSTLATLVALPLAIACEADPKLPPTATFPSCPNFQVIAKDTTLTAGAGTVAAGDVTLVVPANAVEGTLLLRVRRGVVEPAAASVQLNPSTTFRSPITLSMSYARCPELKGAGKTRSLYRVDVTPPQSVGGSDDAAAERVSVQLNGLSEYAMANP